MNVRSAARVAAAAVPVAALSIAIPFVNRVQLHAFGVPFLPVWIVAWMLLTPLCLWVAHRLEVRT